MELEKEIKQTRKFASEYQKLMVNLIYSGSWLSNINNKFLKKFNVTPQQYNILRILKGQHPKPASVNLLIDRMLDKMSNASRLVEKLRQKGLVDRTECKEDRRQVDVYITEQGLQLLEQINQHYMEWESALHTLTEEEAAQLNTLLDKLRG